MEALQELLAVLSQSFTIFVSIQMWVVEMGEQITTALNTVIH